MKMPLCSGNNLGSRVRDPISSQAGLGAHLSGHCPGTQESGDPDDRDPGSLTRSLCPTPSRSRGGHVSGPGSAAEPTLSVPRAAAARAVRRPRSQQRPPTAALQPGGCRRNLQEVIAVGPGPGRAGLRGTGACLGRQQGQGSDPEAVACSSTCRFPQPRPRLWPRPLLPEPCHSLLAVFLLLSILHIAPGLPAPPLRLPLCGPQHQRIAQVLQPELQGFGSLPFCCLPSLLSLAPNGPTVVPLSFYTGCSHIPQGILYFFLVTRVPLRISAITFLRNSLPSPTSSL